MHTTYTLTHIKLLSNHKTIIHIKRAKKNMERVWSLLTLIFTLALTFPISLHSVASLCRLPFAFSRVSFLIKRARKACDHSHRFFVQPPRCPQSEPDPLWLEGGKQHRTRISLSRDGPPVSETQLLALCPAGPLNWSQGSYTSAHSLLPLLSTEGLLSRGMCLFLQRSSLSRGEIREICNEL